MQKNTFRALFTGLVLGAYIDWGTLFVDVMKGFSFTTDLAVEIILPVEAAKEAHQEAYAKNVTPQN
jgi:hypothetical protein